MYQAAMLFKQAKFLASLSRSLCHTLMAVYACLNDEHLGKAAIPMFCKIAPVLFQPACHDRIVLFRNHVPEGSLQQFKWYSSLVTLPFALPLKLQRVTISTLKLEEDLASKYAKLAILVVKQTGLASFRTFKLKASGGQLLSSLASSAKSIMLRSPQPFRK